MKTLMLTMTFFVLCCSPVECQWKTGSQSTLYPIKGENILDIYLAHNNTLYATVKYEYFISLYRSSDLGYSWSEIKRFEDKEKLYFLHTFSREFRKTNPVWITDGVILSKDLGETWSSCRFYYMPEGNQDCGTWGCQGYDYLICSENQIWSYSNGIYCHIHKDENGTYYSYALAQTSDMGSSWSYFLEDVNCRNSSICFLHENKGFFIGENGAFYEYSDSEWIERKTFTITGMNSRLFNPKNTDWQCIDFINEKDGWISGLNEEGNIFLRTNDGGTSWEDISSKAYKISEIHFLNKQHGFAIGSCQTGGALFETTDGGKTWGAFSKPRAPSGPIIMGTGFAIIAPSRGYGERFMENLTDCGFQYLINESIISSNSEIGTDQQILNVYPNPVSDYAVICLPGRQLLHGIEIFDIGGRRVFSSGPVNCVEYSLNRGDLKEGIYIVKGQGDTVFTGKLVVK